MPPARVAQMELRLRGILGGGLEVVRVERSTEEETRAGGHRIVGHGGGAPGMNGRLDMYLDNGCTVVVLANQDPPAAERVAAYVRSRLK